jgi:hypothetical protein
MRRASTPSDGGPWYWAGAFAGREASFSSPAAISYPGGQAFPAEIADGANGAPDAPATNASTTHMDKTGQLKEKNREDLRMEIPPSCRNSIARRVNNVLNGA